jgi:outer membrane protein assembly factor BamB
MLLAKQLGNPFQHKSMKAQANLRNRLRGLALFLAFLLQPILFIPVSGQEVASLSRPIYVKWHIKMDGLTNLAPAVDGERIYLPLDGGSIISLWLADGGLSWKSDIGGSISASPAADSNSVYVASESLSSAKSKYPQATGVLRALSRQSGLTMWMRMLPFPIKGIINFNSNTLFGSSSDGRLYAFKRETGEIKWIKYNSSPFSFQHVLIENNLYIEDEGGDIIAVEQESGNTLWRYRTHKILRAPIVIYEGMAYAGTADGFVFAIDRSNGHLRWRVRTGTAVQTVLAAEKCILATSLDNFVYCLSPQHGAKLWKRQLAGRVVAPPLVLNNSVLLAPLVGDECVILNLDDGKKINSIYVGDDNNTEAPPLLSANLLLLTTRDGLLALSNQALKTPAEDSP